jgi:hypothetical protein
MNIATANVNGIRFLIGNNQAKPSDFNKLDEMYQEVRQAWFEYTARVRAAKRLREKNKESDKTKSVPRALNAELLKKFNDVADKFKISGIDSGRELVEFLKQYPPSKIAASVNDASISQLNKRDAGFNFEAQLASRLRHQPSNLWVGRTAGSYGAADILVFHKHGVRLIQCKKANAMRPSATEHKKLSDLLKVVHKIATVELFYMDNHVLKSVIIDNDSLKVLSGEATSWNAVVAAEVKTSVEMNKMLENLSKRISWRGSIADLKKAYVAVTPIIKRLVECKMQWSAELRLEYRKALDPFRGFMAHQDAHFTKAILSPAYCPVKLVVDEVHADRDSSLEGRITKLPGLSFKTEKESGIKTPIHVVRLNTAKTKFIAYVCRKSGLLSQSEVDTYSDLVSKLPRVVELRLAWYANKRLVKSKVIASRKDAEYFLTQRGI